MDGCYKTNAKCIIYLCQVLLKSGSLDNAIQMFLLAWSSWVMSYYAMFYKYGKRTRDFLGVFILILVQLTIFSWRL